jgi:hypothetical protein
MACREVMASGPIPFVYSLENDNGVDEASNERADQEQYQDGADES